MGKPWSAIAADAVKRENAYLAESITDPYIRWTVSAALRGTEDLATTLLDGDRDRARLLLAAADGFVYRTLVGIVTPQAAEAAIDKELRAVNWIRGWR
jgi:TetR/AcrR family transcriptional repressor of bet genes